MQGIVLLGGNATRLNLFSRRVASKSLAMVYDRLALEYPINTLVRAGITDITCILGGRYNGNIISVLGDGHEFGANLTYVHQQDPKGISDAIYKARGTIKEKVAVILGDNFFEDDITEYVQAFEAQEKGCSIFIKAVPDPERYGVAELDINNKVIDIIEKPKNPNTNLAVTGLYFYDKTLFEKIEKLTPSSRGELEVTDLNMLYVAEGNCNAHTLTGYWNDLGTFDSILETGNFIKKSGFKLNYTIDAWSKK